MPKPPIKKELQSLEIQLIETMKAGHESWRPDLPGPQSSSDWEAVARAVIRMFEVRRRPLGLSQEDIEDREA